MPGAAMHSTTIRNSLFSILCFQGPLVPSRWERYLQGDLLDVSLTGSLHVDKDAAANELHTEHGKSAVSYFQSSKYLSKEFCCYGQTNMDIVITC